MRWDKTEMSEWCDGDGLLSAGVMLGEGQKAMEEGTVNRVVGEGGGRRRAAEEGVCCGSWFFWVRSVVHAGPGGQ